MIGAIIIVIVIVLAVAWWRGWSWADIPFMESFRSCSGCDGRMYPSGMSVLNPFMYPYSGVSCVDDMYIFNHDNGLDLGFPKGPLTHLSTPDHVELV